MPDARIRHQPEKTVLYAVVRDHLDGFLRAAREHGALPAFIEKTFRAFLKCGIPEHGFIRVHCACCGRGDIVAFSCKRRGVCPSCQTRRMSEAAAHLVDARAMGDGAFSNGAAGAAVQPDSSARASNAGVFGILAGGSKDRKLVVPKATHRKRAHAHVGPRDAHGEPSEMG